MSTSVTFKRFVLGFEMIKRRRRKKREHIIQKQRQRAEVTKQYALQEKARRERILALPTQTFTAGAFKKLPQGVDLDLQTCPLGTWFICAPCSASNDIVVVGHIVHGHELIADQWGAGMSPPGRGINRYRVNFV